MMEDRILRALEGEALSVQALRDRGLWDLPTMIRLLDAGQVVRLDGPNGVFAATNQRINPLAEGQGRPQLALDDVLRAAGELTESGQLCSKGRPQLTLDDVLRAVRELAESGQPCSIRRLATHLRRTERTISRHRDWFQQALALYAELVPATQESEPGPMRRCPRCFTLSADLQQVSQNSAKVCPDCRAEYARLKCCKQA